MTLVKVNLLFEQVEAINNYYSPRINFDLIHQKNNQSDKRTSIPRSSIYSLNVNHNRKINILLARVTIILFVQYLIGKKMLNYSFSLNNKRVDKMSVFFRGIERMREAK